MRYKTSQKILIDKRKLETLLRLECPKEILIDLIFENKLTLTGDSLIDDNLESLLEIKEFKNWGGNHNPKGNNQYSLGQVDQLVDQGQDIGQVGDKDKDKDKDINSINNSVVELNSKILPLNEKEKENLTKEKESFDLKNWHGEYKNVHLNPIQFAKFVQHVGSKDVAQNIIEELSSNIASKHPNAPPYDEAFPDMHLVKLKAYWKHRRLNRGSPQTFTDRQNEFTAQIKALANKYRIEEEKERKHSG